MSVLDQSSRKFFPHMAIEVHLTPRLLSILPSAPFASAAVVGGEHTYRDGTAGEASGEGRQVRLCPHPGRSKGSVGSQAGGQAGGGGRWQAGRLEINGPLPHHSVPVAAVLPTWASSIATVVMRQRSVRASTRVTIYAGEFDAPRWFVAPSIGMAAASVAAGVLLSPPSPRPASGGYCSAPPALGFDDADP